MKREQKRALLFIGLAIAVSLLMEIKVRMALVSSCSAPGVDPKLQIALCAGDPSSIRDALFGIAEYPGQPDRMRLHSAIKKLWEDDKTYGAGLPWPALETVQSRVIFADHFAQAIRNGEIDGSILDMQRFAVHLVHSANRDTDQLEGIHLLGITDANDEVPLLRGIALSDADRAVRRRHAIEALGYICAPDAAFALREMARSFAATSAEAKYVTTAQTVRLHLSRSWCRNAPSIEPPT